MLRKELLLLELLLQLLRVEALSHSEEVLHLAALLQILEHTLDLVPWYCLS